MSAKIFGLVWDLELPREEQTILLALADHADHEGNNVFPSVGLIAWKTNYCERRVQELMRRLEAKGLLVKVGESVGRGRTVKYRINLDAGTFKAPYRKGAISAPFSPQRDARKGEIPEAERVQSGAPKGELATAPESNTEPKARTFPLNPPAIEIVRHPSDEKAGSLQDLIQRKLERAGYEVKHEYPIWQGERYARMDLRAKRGKEILSIELDRKNPRDKSLEKLAMDSDATRRLIILRDPGGGFADAPLFDDVIGTLSA